MASSGVSAWTKYFQGRGDVPTTIKKDSKLYDPDETSKVIGEVQAGTKITYLSTPSYDPRALILVGDKKGRVTFNNITKPGVKASAAVSLKPQSFNVASESKRWSLREYNKNVYDAIEDRKDLKPELKSYLYCLVEHYNGNKSRQELASIFTKVKNDIPLNDINKDFGEVLGPIGIINQQMMKPKGITFSSNARIYVPIRPNEPLMDYGIEDRDRLYTISAKSGKTTNTVKPGDIIDLLSKVPEKLRYWKTTQQFKILEQLRDASIVMGPIRAVASLYPKLIDPKAAARTEKNKYDISDFINFISQNEYLSKQKDPTIIQIMYECEKMLQNLTKTAKIDMNEIFKDAIEEKVIYVRFEVGSNGTGVWEVTMSDDIMTKGKRTFLRTKNGYTRAADRMGIQL